MPRQDSSAFAFMIVIDGGHGGQCITTSNSGMNPRYEHCFIDESMMSWLKGAWMQLYSLVGVFISQGSNVIRSGLLESFRGRREDVYVISNQTLFGAQQASLCTSPIMST